MSRPGPYCPVLGLIVGIGDFAWVFATRNLFALGA